MKQIELAQVEEWARGFLGIAHSRAEAEEGYAYWERRAQDFSGAEIRVTVISNTLGGYCYVLRTNSRELSKEKVWATPEEMRAMATCEDSGAVGLLRTLFTDRTL